MTDHIENIRKALAAGPTPGEWKVRNDRVHGESVLHVVGPSDVVSGDDGICSPHRLNDRTFEEDKRNMLYIAACNPVAIAALLAELDRLKAIVDGCDWYWPEDDTSSDACADGPWQIAENCDVKPGEVFGYSRGGVVETRFFASLPPADDADSGDDFEVDCATREEAEAAIAAELERRASNADHR